MTNINDYLAGLKRPSDAGENCTCSDYSCCVEHLERLDGCILRSNALPVLLKMLTYVHSRLPCSVLRDDIVGHLQRILDESEANNETR